MMCNEKSNCEWHAREIPNTRCLSARSCGRKRFSEQTAARKQTSHNLHLICLLRLLETDLQDLHLSHHTL